MFSTFGHVFRVTSFGESHGAAVGVVIDGCPSGIHFSIDAVQAQLDRRRPGQTHLNTPRREADRVEVLSGVQAGVTLGTPIALHVRNLDMRPGDYGDLDAAPRPSHADYTYFAKYGLRARSGGGRASARETLARVAAGAVAEMLLRPKGVEIVAWVSSVGDVCAPLPNLERIDRSLVDAHPVRCPDAAAANRMQALIESVMEDNDSIGGVVTCLCRNVPPGWGEPVFDKLDACLAHAMLSIPATKGFEIGSGFASVTMRGSEHNDLFEVRAGGRLGTRTNRSGGVQGGISNGETILFRVAFKPVATVGKAQKTVDYEGAPVCMEARGRHDPCVLPRAVAVVEGMAAMVLADAALQHARMGGGEFNGLPTT